jgi:hypothetical protein
MPSAHPISETPDQRAWVPIPGSYILLPGDQPPLWFFAFPDPSSFIVFARPRRKPRRKRARAALSSADRARAYAELLNADDYSEAARDALRAGDDDAVRDALAVLRAIVEVVTAQLRGSSYECLVTLQ